MTINSSDVTQETFLNILSDETDLRPTCILLVGLPCSGKSTFALKLNEIRRGRDIIVSSDDFIDSFASYIGKTYNDVFPIYQPVAELIFFKQLGDLIASRTNIIVDRTNLTYQSRDRIYTALDGKYRVIVVEFGTDIVEILHRNNRPGKIIPEEVIENMVLKRNPVNLYEEVDYVFRADSD